MHKNHFFIYIGLNPDEVDIELSNIRNVADIGHYGTGDVEIRIEKAEDIPAAKKYIMLGYENYTP